MIGVRKFRTTSARKRERVRFVLVTALWIIGACVAVGGWWYAMHASFLRISKVTISPETIVEHESIHTAVQANLADSYLYLVPKDLVLVPQTKRLMTLITTRFPHVRTVTVHRPTPRSLAIALEARTPDGLWCGDVVPPVAQERPGEHTSKEDLWGTCYLMDADAFMYARAPTFGGNVLPRFYGSLARAEPVGQTYVDPPTYRAWRALYDRLRGADHTPDAVLFVDERDAELYIDGARILVPRDGDLNGLWRRLEALLTNKVVDDTRAVEYIDVRTNSKAFVRYVNSEEGRVASPTPVTTL